MIFRGLVALSVALALVGLAQMALTETDPTLTGLASMACILGAMLFDW